MADRPDFRDWLHGTTSGGNGSPPNQPHQPPDRYPDDQLGDAFEGEMPRIAEGTEPEMPELVSEETLNGGSLWPDPPAKEAYSGLAGEIVQAIEPETEADPVAILAQFLAAFGNAVGRTAYRPVGPKRHYSNLFVCLVGRTAIGRKGTAWSWVESLMGVADPDWLNECVVCGLSSGEGLIAALRDDDRAERRLMAVEEEFGSVLRAASRDGSILSGVVRQGWDGGRLRILTRHNPLCATDSHISLVGHVTPVELRKLLSETERSNGFANRFLWVACQRSKVLPDGGERLNLSGFGAQLSIAIEQAKQRTMLGRDSAAQALWHECYGHLTAEPLGILGMVTSRAAPQVLRLSVLYALLDCSNQVCERHIRSALAFWDYCVRSALWVFGNSTGNRDADEILEALRLAPNGLTRSEISGIFNRNKSVGQIQQALQILLEAGLIIPGSPARGGKPAEKYRLRKHESTRIQTNPHES